MLTSHKPNIDEITAFFKIKTLYRFKRRETEIVDNLIEFLDELDIDIEYNFQYNVETYRTDICLPTHKLIIEVDENGHKYRDIEYEKKREKRIKKKTGFEIFRCYPDEKDFTINKFLANVTTKLFIN